MANSKGPFPGIVQRVYQAKNDDWHVVAKLAKPKGMVVDCNSGRHCLPVGYHVLVERDGTEWRLVRRR